MRFTVKGMVALLLALLLAVPSFALAEEPVIQSEEVDEIVETIDLDWGSDDTDAGLIAEYSPKDSDTAIDTADAGDEAEAVAVVSDEEAVPAEAGDEAEVIAVVSDEEAAPADADDEAEAIAVVSDEEAVPADADDEAEAIAVVSDEEAAPADADDTADADDEAEADAPFVAFEATDVLYEDGEDELKDVYQIMNGSFGPQNADWENDAVWVKSEAYIGEDRVYQAKAGQTVTLKLKVGSEAECTGLTVYEYTGENPDYQNDKTEVPLTQVSDTEYTFTMPEANVYFSVLGRIKGVYQINTGSTSPVPNPDWENDAILVKYEAYIGEDVVYQAKAGQTVTLKLKVGSEVECTGITACEYMGEHPDYNNDNTEVPLTPVSDTEYTFTMPEANVFFRINCMAAPVDGGEFAINIVKSEHGSATAMRNGTAVRSANANDLINISPRPNQNYAANRIVVTDENGNVLSDSVGGAGFTMPNGPVTVTVDFIESYEIAVTPENFPDENLRNYLAMPYSGSYTKSPDDPTRYIGSAISYLYLEGVNDFTGLELFNNLKQLSIIGCSGTALELASDTVESIMLAECENLTSVNVSGCTSLKTLNFEWNMPNIAKLDVSGCAQLTELYARGAALTALDVSRNTELKVLDCNSNKLTELDVSKNYKLEQLSCYNNQLTTLAIAKNPNIVAYVDGKDYEEVTTEEDDNCIVYKSDKTTKWGGEIWALACDKGVEIVTAQMFDITVADVENGAVDAPGAALTKQTVTVKLTADEGYAIKGIEVSGATVGAVEVTEKSEGEYTFIMPAEDVTITAAFQPKLVITAPEALELTFNGEAQALVTAATANGGKVQYSLDGENWSEAIPTATDAGTYSVYYQVVETEGYVGEGTGNEPVEVTVAPKTVTVTVTPKDNKTFGDEADPELDVVADGLLNGAELTGKPEREEGDDVGNYAYTVGTLAVSDAKNYVIEKVEGKLVILPKTVEIEWDNLELTYNGYEQGPTAAVKGDDACAVTVTGLQVDAGTYTATAAALSNANYQLPDERTAEFTIAKMEAEDVTYADTVQVAFQGVEDAKLDLSEALKDAETWTVVADPDEALVTKAAFDEDSKVLTYTTADTTDTEITDGKVVIAVSAKNVEDYKLTVNFATGDVFTLRLEPNGGVAELDRRLHEGEAYGELPVRERNGYTFDGWFADEALTTEVTAETEMGAADATIYAKWTAKTHTISMIQPEDLPEAIDIPDESKTVTVEDEAFELPVLETQTVDGTTYTFAGWTKDGEEEAQLIVTIDPAELTYDEGSATAYTAKWIEGKADGKVSVETAAGNGLLGLADMKGDEASTGEDAEETTALAQAMKEIAIANASAAEVPEDASQEIVVAMEIKAADALDAIENELPENAEVKFTTDYIDINIIKTITTSVEGEEDQVDTEPVAETARVMEIPVQFNMNGRYNPVVYRAHGEAQEVTTFNRIYSRPKEASRVDGTYFVSGYGSDTVIYIYSQNFSTFAVSTDDDATPKVHLVPNNGEDAFDGALDEEGKLVTPAEPKKASEGDTAYRFSGWYTDEALTRAFNADEVVSKEMTLYAAYEAQVKVAVTVTGDFNGTYDGAAHTITVTVDDTEGDVVVYYGDKEIGPDNYETDGKTEAPSYTEAGTNATIYWYAHSITGKRLPDPASGSVTIVINAPAAPAAPAVTVAAPAAPVVAPEPTPVIPVLKKSVKATALVGKVYQIDLGGAVAKSFKSSKKKIATVTSTGLITPKAKGKTKITVKIGKKKRVLTLTVKDPTIPNRVTLSVPGGNTVKKGDVVTLTAVLPEGTNSAIKWKSSNKKIATVNAQGVVTFKKAGKVTITATAKRGKKKAKVKFKVTK